MAAWRYEISLLVLKTTLEEKFRVSARRCKEHMDIFWNYTVFLVSLHDHDVKMPNFMFYGGRKQTKTNFLPFLNVDMISPTFEEVREKV